MGFGVSVSEDQIQRSQSGDILVNLAENARSTSLIQETQFDRSQPGLGGPSKLQTTRRVQQPGSVSNRRTTLQRAAPTIILESLRQVWVVGSDGIKFEVMESSFE